MPARSSASQISGSTPSSRKVVTVFSSLSFESLVRVGVEPAAADPGSNARTGVCRAHPGARSCAGARPHRSCGDQPQSIGSVCACPNPRPIRRAGAADRAGSSSRTPTTARPWSTSSARSRTARSRRSSGSSTTPSWRRRCATRSRWAAMASLGVRPRRRALHDRIRELGADPFDAMAPFEAAIDLFHAHTAPADWYEGLVKAYVGDGLAADFYREIAAYLDADTRDLIIASLEDTGQADFVVDRIRAGHRGRPEARRPAGAVGPPADGRGADPGAAGGRRARRADRAAGRRHRPARASTWPRSAGCSPGSPSGTPSGWPSSASRPDLGSSAVAPAAVR